MVRTAQRDWERSPHPAMTYRPPPVLRRTRAVVSVLLSTILVVGVWSLLWYSTLIWVQNQIRNWVADQAAHGVVAQYDRLEISGYPMRVIVRLFKPHYNGTLFGESVDWRGNALVISSRLWMPWRLRVEAPGRFDFKLNAPKMEFAGQVKSLGITFAPGRKWLDNMALNVQKLNLSGSASVVVKDLSLRSERENQALILALAGRGWTLPLRGGWGLGDKIDSFDARLRVTGPLGSRGTLAARLAHWRDADGAINIERFKVRAGPFALSATGSLSLDQNFQPQGAFTAKMKGLFSVLEILRTKGLIQGPNAVLATMALSAFSTRAKDGGASSITLPVTVQNGNLSLGPVLVAKIPMINWGFVKKKPQTPPPRNYKDVPPVF